MLVIRHEQLAAFERARVDDFVERASGWLRERHPEPARPLGDDGVRATVRDAIARSARAGIVSEDGVLLYLRAMVEAGHDFDREPWAGFLRDPRLDPAQKLVKLATVLYERDE
jgi:hypothetical protein